MSRRSLSVEEETLWSGVARSVKPLRPGAPKGKGRAKAISVAEDVKPAPQRIAKASSPPATSAKKLPPLAPLDKRQNQRVARGRQAIDARIDLHGMTQSQAHTALLHFVRQAQGAGARIVLVVTGKGSAKASRSVSETSFDAEREPGVLRRQVPFWLALPEFRPFIVGFDQAHVAHGGHGALYVRIRRIR
jgi:DNA-nicking Smr family endonuclease